MRTAIEYLAGFMRGQRRPWWAGGADETPARLTVPTDLE